MGWLATAGLLASAFTGSAEFFLRPYQEPRWFSMQIDRVYTGVYAEFYRQTTSVNGGSESYQDRSFLGPLLGLDLSGSVYHPNLLNYHVNVDGSLGWTEDDFSGAVNSSQRQIRFLGSFLAEANWLDSKPLHGRLFSSYSHSYRDYDFFNRIYIDTWRYGASLNYTQGPFTFYATVMQETQDATGNPVPIWSDSTIATASLTHRRASGSTSLSGSFNDYTRTDYGVGSDGHDYNISLSDSEDFGARKNWHSVATLGYNYIQSLSVPSDLYTAILNVRAEHSDTLRSQYVVNYSRNTYGDSKNDNLSGNALLEHKLFQSLTTDITLQGYRYSAESGPDKQDSWQLGGGPGFHYSKRLGKTSSLTAYENFGFFHTDVQSSGGLIPVLDEKYFFGTGTGGNTVTLRQPNVILSSIIITDTSHLPPGGYIEGLDYDVIPNGQFTVIERLAGSRLPNTVLISYNFVASPSGSYDTVNNAFGLRFDLFENRLSLYTRYTMTRNDGPENLVVQDLDIFLVGVEGHWKALRAGAEYERYDSSLSPYDAFRLFESLTFAPEERSTLRFNLTQSFMSYQSARREDQNYTATVNYTRALTRRLGFNVEAGASQRVSTGADQTIAIFRPQLQYAAGKFSASIGYDLNYDEYLNSQKRVRNLGFIRLRKDF